jgi:hypothetical protein
MRRGRPLMGYGNADVRPVFSNRLVTRSEETLSRVMNIEDVFSRVEHVDLQYLNYLCSEPMSAFQSALAIQTVATNTNSPL